VVETEARRRAREEVARTIRDKLLKAFDDPELMGPYGEFRTGPRALTDEQWKAAKDTFLAHYLDVIKLF
jgi:hypothetical protein